MLKRIKSHSLLIKAIAWVLIFGFSGLEQVAHAVPCDTGTFEAFFLAPDGKSTIAITKQKYTWQVAGTTAKAANGRLVVITSEQQNAAIFSNLSTHFAATPMPTSTAQDKAWINLWDPLNSPAWSVEGSAPVIMPSRFSWGADFSAYQNWASGQPDGFCSLQEQANHPDHGCYGEPWAVINTDGKWSDEGNHTSADVTLKGVVEWPQVTLDCVAPVSEAVEAQPETLPGAEDGVQWCTDSTRTQMTECVDAAGGGKLCPNELVACNAVQENPVCPSGSALNTERDMCQAPPTIICGAGYSWDASIDRCIATAICPDGGVLNTNTDKCEKLVLNGCPTGYTYDSNVSSPTYDKCIKTVNCGTGTFNALKDRCEAPPAWSCPTGFSYNATSSKCEAVPSCAPGTTYNTTTNRCEAALSACPTGYSYNAVLDKCVVSATCSSGGTLNGTSDKCELTSGISCPIGTTYNATSGKCESAPTCVSPGTYNTTYDVCLTPTTGTVCPSGYSYSATYGACVASPACAGGTYSAVNNRCEATPSYTCSDPSYTYNSTRGRCEKAPVCASGMVYNTTYNVCTQAITPTCGAGYTYVAARSRCEKTPECSSGAYNPVTNKCESSSSYTATGTSSGGITFDIPLHIFTEGRLYYSTEITEISVYITSKPTGGSIAYFNPSGSDIEYSDVFVSTSNPYAQLIIGGYISPFQYPGFIPVYEISYPNGDNNYSISNIAPDPATYKGLKGYLPTTPGVYGAGTTYSCPSGGTLSGTTCTTVTQVNPTCTNGTMDYTNDVCYAPYTPTCSQGAYDSASGYCVATPTCSNGALDGTVDKCYQARSGGCPSGYTLSGSICVDTTPTCPTGGSFDATIDYCKASVNWSCPTGYSYSSTYGQCYQTANCGAGSLNATTDKCQQSYTSTCPSGYVLNGSTCQASPTCTTGGAYNTSLNLCAGSGSLCGTLSFDASADKCYQAANCSSGTLNTSTDKCEAVATVNCGTSTWDNTAGICYSSPVCSLGSYDSALNTCVGALAKDCGTYTLKDTTTCQLSPPCSGDPSFPLNNTVAYSTELDKCVSQTQHDCTAGTTYIGLPIEKCEAVPVCPNGMYFPSSDTCYNSTHSCPVGDFACRQISGDTTEVAPGVPIQYCSPNACQSDTSGWIENTDTESGLTETVRRTVNVSATYTSTTGPTCGAVKPT